MSNKKQNIGIISLYWDNNNYGGLLQAYALTKFLNSRNYNTKQISFRREFLHPKSIFTRYLDNIKNYGFFKSVFLKIFFTLRQRKHKNQVNYNKNIKQRNKSFHNFRLSVPHTKKEYYKDTITAIPNIDTYICGSDQIWSFDKNLFNEAFWLNFVNNKKKIAYAASPSINYKNNKQLEFFYNNTKDFSAISFREKQSTITKTSNNTYIKHLQENLITVLDPVFLLSKHDWTKICKPKIDPKATACVFLYSKSNKYRKIIKEYCSNNKLKIINFPYLENYRNKNDENFADINIYEGPETLLSCIKDSEIIFTDSFHILAFSIIFNKPIVVFKRNTKFPFFHTNNKRIENLLNIFTPNVTIIDDNTNEKIIENVFKNPIYIDESTYLNKIEKLKNYSIKFLIDALNK